MTTIMSWGNSEGTRGRCDGKCHNAKGTRCTCMCGGVFHGTKRNGTFDRVFKQHAQEVIEAAKRQAEAQGWEVEVKELLPLFDSSIDEDHDETSTDATA